MGKSTISQLLFEFEELFLVFPFEGAFEPVFEVALANSCFSNSRANSSFLFDISLSILALRISGPSLSKIFIVLSKPNSFAFFNNSSFSLPGTVFFLYLN